MIAYLEGRLLSVSDPAVLIVTGGGVGYEVEVTARCRQSLPPAGEKVALYTSLLVREDMLRLCGFQTLEERRMFDTLVSIPKVGPKLALGVLSMYPPAELRRLVADADTVSLTAVSGIGKRLAETLCRELAYRFKMDAGAQLAAQAENGGPGSVFVRVLEGLKGLGYAEAECSGVIQELLRAQPDLDVAGALRATLQELGRRRQ